MNLRNTTLEQLVLQSMAVAPQDDGSGQPLQIMHSNTMEHFLRTMSGANEEMVFNWGSMPQDVSQSARRGTAHCA